MSKVQFNSPKEFALYIQDRFLKPYFVFEEVDNGVPNVRRSIAKLKTLKPMNNKAIYKAYEEIIYEISDLAEEEKQYYWHKENYSDFKGYFQQDNLYFNSNCLIYIKSSEYTEEGRNKLLIYILNMSYITDGALELVRGDVADIWLNSYNSYSDRILNNSDDGLFFRVPLEKLIVMDFMNWDSNPLEGEK
jgi:hypothetical protein